jgi:hypothetical protein
MQIGLAAGSAEVGRRPRAEALRTTDAAAPAATRPVCAGRPGRPWPARRVTGALGVSDLNTEPGALRNTAGVTGSNSWPLFGSATAKVSAAATAVILGRRRIAVGCYLLGCGMSHLIFGLTPR